MNKLGKLTLATAIVLGLASPAIAEIKEKTCAEVNTKLGDLPTQTLNKLRESYKIGVAGNSKLETEANRSNEETANCISDMIAKKEKFSTLSDDLLRQLILSYSKKIEGDGELARTINAGNEETVILAKQELASRK